MSETITVPSGSTGRIRGMKAREPRCPRRRRRSLGHVTSQLPTAA